MPRTMLRVTFDQFESAAASGNLIPVYEELLADMETPVSVFRKLSAPSPYSFLLESVEGGEQLGRYSFIGVDPAIVLRAEGDRQTLVQNGQDLAPKETPVETLRWLLSRYEHVPNPDLPPFTGGAVGYLGYDTVRYFERIPDTCPDDLELPDCVVMVAESVVAFDHVKHRMLLIVNAHTEGFSDLRAAYDDAVERLAELRRRVRQGRHTQDYVPKFEDGASAPAGGYEVSAADLAPVTLPVRSTMERHEYEGAVSRAKEYIAAGDVFQVVLSQRFCAQVSCHPFDVYRALRAVNPSPYMFYLNCGGDFQLAGSSPEILTRLTEEGEVVVRPIAGTRKRGATPAEDKALEDDLLADEKERAEHVMLIDLGRNDVGRVSKYGSVRVTDLMVIERYSHVMHIVSNVRGEIAEGKDALDVLGATFPAGTLSGAPKIRAMEVIDELEATRRGPYGGTVVYFGFNGTMDSCIIIRTALIKGNQVYVQAGAGVVADSVAASEYMETVNKAKGMLRAIEMANAGLD